MAPVRVHRDSHGYVRVITAHVSYQRLVERAFEKIRQASRGMPAVQIRQLEALTKIIDHTTTARAARAPPRAGGDDPPGRARSPSRNPPTAPTSSGNTTRCCARRLKTAELEGR